MQFYLHIIWECFSAGFTAFYSFRLLYLTFISQPNGFKSSFEHAHEPGWFMVVPLLVLACGSLFWGWFSRDMFVGLGTSFWGVSIAMPPIESLSTSMESEFLPTAVKFIPLIVSFVGIVLSLGLYTFASPMLFAAKTTSLGKAMFSFLSKKWFFDNVYNLIVVKFVLQLAYWGTFKFVDRGFFEVFGANGLVALFRRLSSAITSLHSGYIFDAAFIMLAGLGLCGILLLILFVKPSIFWVHLLPVLVAVFVILWRFLFQK